MNDLVRVAKWLLAPTSILIAQIWLDMNGAFNSDVAHWCFIATSAVLLLVWRHRLGKLALRFSRAKFPRTENMNCADRRFAFWSMTLSFALLFAVQLAILAFVGFGVPWAQTHSGTLWTVFGITAVGFWQIAMGINCLIVSYSSRWHAILEELSREAPVN